MQFHPERFYHIYNRGNNRQRIFFTKANYIFFIKKLERHIVPHATILAYCLMPNHFHLLVYIKETSVNHQASQHPLIKGIAKLLSSYAQAINKQQKMSGALFQPKTKAIDLTAQDDNKADRITTCFHYIHQNPLRGQLTDSLRAWPYSSYNDYIQPSRYSICDRRLAFQFLELNEQFFELESYQAIPDSY